MGFMVDNHTLALTLRWLSTINPWLPCYNYNIQATHCQSLSIFSSLDVWAVFIVTGALRGRWCYSCTLVCHECAALDHYLLHILGFTDRVSVSQESQWQE